jgi:hypothetical protein
MNVRTFLLTGATLLAAQTASATTPTISGSYNLSTSEYCQPVYNPWPTGTQLSYEGLHASSIGTADFDSSTGNVSATGETISGKVIVTNSTAGNMTAAPYTLSGPYSNTATTFTLDGTDYQVDYAYVVKGLAQTFHFYTTTTLGTGVTAANCVVQGSAALQK